MIQAKEIKLVPISEIKLDPKNRNKHPKEQIERLAAIIEYQGFRNPVVISNRTGYLKAGEGRFLAAKKLKLKEIPATYQDFDSEEQETAYGISDNAISAWAELDLSGINADIQGLGEDFNIDLLGVKDFSITEVDLPELNSGDKEPLQQITFTLSDEQAEKIKEAIEKAKSMGPLVDEINKNANGNAISRVAELFLNEC